MILLSNSMPFNLSSILQSSALRLTGGLLPLTLPLLLLAATRLVQAAPAQTMQLRANVTEANSKTGVVVARGNVLITYPARQIEATAAQAIYYSKEGKIILSGNVNILQEGNRLKGETVTYLVNEGRFVALPQENSQVEATYIIKDTPESAPAPAPIPTNPARVKPLKIPFPVAPRPEGAVLQSPNPDTTAP